MKAIYLNTYGNPAESLRAIEVLEPDTPSAREALVRQVTGSVKWSESMQWLTAKDVSTFIEVGPGKVLCGLMRQIDRSRKCLNVEDEASLQKTMQALAQ
jgi:[acyl-carrier-protein] S-malonyltransferase